MNLYVTEIECLDVALDVAYFTVKVFDEASATITSDVCIGSIEELDEYLANIRKAFVTMFPEWEEVSK